VQIDEMSCDSAWDQSKLAAGTDKNYDLGVKAQEFHYKKRGRNI